MESSQGHSSGFVAARESNKTERLSQQLGPCNYHCFPREISTTCLHFSLSSHGLAQPDKVVSAEKMST